MRKARGVAPFQQRPYMKEDRTDFSMKRTNFYTKRDPFVREKRPAAGRERCVLHVLFEKDPIST